MPGERTTDVEEVQRSVSSMSFPAYSEYRAAETCKPRRSYEPCKDKFDCSTTSSDTYKVWKVETPTRPPWSISPPATPYVPGEKQTSEYKQTYIDRPSPERVKMIFPHSEGIALTDDNCPFNTSTSYNADYVNSGKNFRRTKSFRVRDVYKAPTEKMFSDSSYTAEYKGVKAKPVTPIYPKSSGLDDISENAFIPRRTTHKELFPAEHSTSPRSPTKEGSKSPSPRKGRSSESGSVDSSMSEDVMNGGGGGGGGHMNGHAVRNGTGTTPKSGSGSAVKTRITKIFSRKADARANSPLVQLDKEKVRAEKQALVQAARAEREAARKQREAGKAEREAAVKEEREAARRERIQRKETAEKTTGKNVKSPRKETASKKSPKKDTVKTTTKTKTATGGDKETKTEVTTTETDNGMETVTSTVTEVRTTSVVESNGTFDS